MLDQPPVVDGAAPPVVEPYSLEELRVLVRDGLPQLPGRWLRLVPALVGAAFLAAGSGFDREGRFSASSIPFLFLILVVVIATGWVVLASRRRRRRLLGGTGSEGHQRREICNDLWSVVSQGDGPTSVLWLLLAFGALAAWKAADAASSSPMQPGDVLTDVGFALVWFSIGAGGLWNRKHVRPLWEPIRLRLEATRAALGPVGTPAS